MQKDIRNNVIVFLISVFIVWLIFITRDSVKPVSWSIKIISVFLIYGVWALFYAKQNINEAKINERVAAEKKKMEKYLSDPNLPWSKDSLRHKYLHAKYLTERKGLLEIFSPLIKNFICPNCLKTVSISELTVTCPYCDKVYGDKNFSSSKEMEAVIFKKCKGCEGKIKDIECYHCGGTIDLFASYNEKELERRRYGK